MIMFMIKFGITRKLTLLCLINELMKFVDDRFRSLPWIFRWYHYLRFFLILFVFYMWNLSSRLLIHFELMRADSIAMIFIIFGIWFQFGLRRVTRTLSDVVLRWSLNIKLTVEVIVSSYGLFPTYRIIKYAEYWSSF